MNNKGYEDIGFAKIDHDRQNRQGYPEVIFGAGKTCEQAALIFKRIKEHGNAAICTRASKEMADAVISLVPEAEYIAICHQNHSRYPMASLTLLTPIRRMDPSGFILSRQVLGRMQVENPILTASFTRCSAIVTARTSPERPTSPNSITPGSTGRSL